MAPMKTIGAISKLFDRKPPGASVEPARVGHMKSLPAIHVEIDAEPSEMAALLRDTGAVWRKLGESEPHWSVLTSPEYRKSRLHQAEIQAFRDSGRREIDVIRTVLGRAGKHFDKCGTVLEFGCGVGRVTEWFVREGKTITGVDISPGHLAVAKEAIVSCGPGEATFVQATEIDDLKRLAAVDFVYSIIVLQHNPPPVAYRLLSQLMDKVAPGGLIYFQVPTYIRDYEFRVVGYRHNPDAMEMHCIPMRDVLALLDGRGLKLLDVFEDDSSGSPAIISHTFLAARDPA